MRPMRWVGLCSAAVLSTACGAAEQARVWVASSEDRMQGTCERIEIKEPGIVAYCGNRRLYECVVGKDVVKVVTGAGALEVQLSEHGADELKRCMEAAIGGRVLVVRGGGIVADARIAEPIGSRSLRVPLQESPEAGQAKTGRAY
ncbi:hypothetical protein [[Pseudomonas] boreopolis]|uniref:hypothetical protein n=1 Tax=Xanthomonas boreopolis TaxID=86183 RepID=UPI003DA0BDF3